MFNLTVPLFPTNQTHEHGLHFNLLLSTVASRKLGKGALGQFHMIRHRTALHAGNFVDGTSHLSIPNSRPEVYAKTMMDICQPMNFNQYKVSPYGENTFDFSLIACEAILAKWNLASHFSRTGKMRETVKIVPSWSTVNDRKVKGMLCAKCPIPEHRECSATTHANRCASGLYPLGRCAHKSCQ